MAYGIKDLRKCVVNHNRILKLYQEGNAIIEISRVTGYSRNTIKAHLKRAGVYENPLDRKGNIYSGDFNKHLGNNRFKNNLEEGHSAPPSVIEDFRSDFEKCQENWEKNIGDIVVVEENRQREAGIEAGETEEEEEAEQEEEQEVIEADTINLHSREQARDLAISIDQKQIAEIDRVINYALKLLKDKDRLKRSKTSVLNTIVSTMVEKKKMLQGLDPKNKNIDQVIVNFFMNRDFMKEIQKMKALKDKSM